MNRGQLRTEIFAQGYDFLSAVRANQFVNDAYRDLCAEDFWPFLEATASGAAPLTISDLRTVESVTNTDAPGVLVHRKRRELRERYGVLTTTGPPTYFYIDAGEVVRTYPVGGTLSVDYWKVPAELTDDTESPIVPSQYHRLILDMAVRYAAADRGDDDSRARILSLDAAIERRLGVMRENLLVTQRDGDFIEIVSGSDDG